MNRTIMIILGAAILLAASFITGRCTAPKETVTKKVTIPEIIGKSDTIFKPIPYSIKGKDSIIYKNTVLRTDSEFDKDMVERYKKLETDYDRIKLVYESAIINETRIPYEDSLIKIDNFFRTRGEVLAFQQNYTLKEREIQVQKELPKVNKLSFFIGTGISNNKSLDSFSAELSAGIQTKKGMYEVAYDTEQEWSLRYKIKL